MDRGAWQLQSMGSQRVRHDWVCTHALSRHCKFVKPIGCSTSRVNPGTSPVVQWRRRPASTAGATGSIPGRGTKILHSKWHGQKMFFEKESEHNRERGTWSDGHVLM